MLKIIIPVIIIVVIAIVLYPRIENFKIYNSIITYIINLKTRSDKKINIINELHNSNINNYKIIEAVNGNDLDKSVINNINNDSIERKLRNGEIGCYLSHVNVWNSFLFNESSNYCLILEDDAVFNLQQFKLNNIIDELTDLNIDILYLTDNCDGWFGESECKNGSFISNDIFNPKRIGYGLYGYIINKKAAKYLISKSKPITRPIDVLLSDLHLKNEIKFAKLRSPLINVRSLTDSDTQKI